MKFVRDLQKGIDDNTCLILMLSPARCFACAIFNPVKMARMAFGNSPYFRVQKMEAKREVQQLTNIMKTLTKGRIVHGNFRPKPEFFFFNLYWG